VLAEHGRAAVRHVLPLLTTSATCVDVRRGHRCRWERERERERESVEREREGEKSESESERGARKRVSEREREMFCSSAWCHTDAVSRLRAGMCGCVTLVVAGPVRVLRLSNGRVARGARADQ